MKVKKDMPEHRIATTVRQWKKEASGSNEKVGTRKGTMARLPGQQTSLSTFYT